MAKHANETDRAGRVTWGDAISADAREDCASDADQSGEGNGCKCRGMGLECECSAVGSGDDVDVEGASTKKRKSSAAEEISSGLLSQLLGVLRMVV